VRFGFCLVGFGGKEGKREMGRVIRIGTTTRGRGQARVKESPSSQSMRGWVREAEGGGAEAVWALLSARCSGSGMPPMPPRWWWLSASCRCCRGCFALVIWSLPRASLWVVFEAPRRAGFGFSFGLPLPFGFLRHSLVSAAVLRSLRPAPLLAGDGRRGW